MIFTPALVVQNQQPPLGYQNDSVSKKTSPLMSRSDFDLLVPSKEEYESFKFLFTGYMEHDKFDLERLVNSGFYSAYTWTIQRGTKETLREKGMLMITITLALSVNPDSVGMVSSLGVSNLANNPFEKKGSFSGKPLGKYAWNYPTSLFVEDNWLLMKIDLRPQNLRNPDNSVTFGSLTDADQLLAEELGRKILDRATVLGLTSRPAASAPLWAKEQVTKRRAERKL